MNKATGSLTVFFSGPFWVGVFERTENGKLSVCKVTFGAEPKDSEIYEYVLKNYCGLKFSPDVPANAKDKKINPKRMQREVKKQLYTGIGTRSQQALKLQQEQMKTERRKKSHEQRCAEKQRRFEIRQDKRKEKHKGH